MDPSQNLWEATYPPYLQTIFFFQNCQCPNYSVSLTLDPMGAKKKEKKNQNAAPPTVLSGPHLW